MGIDFLISNPRALNVKFNWEVIILIYNCLLLQATTYNYAVYSQDAASYQQQPPTQSIATSFQQPSDNVTSYQQQQTTIINNTQYQQQQVYQQASTQYTQASTVQSGYEQAPIPITTDPYQQQATESSQQVGPTGQYDYSKRPRY